MNGPLPYQYFNSNPDVVMMGSKLAHRPVKVVKKTDAGKIVLDENGLWVFIYTDPPRTYCGKKGGEIVTYEEFRAARKSWMVCTPCWAPERTKRRF